MDVHPPVDSYGLERGATVNPQTIYLRFNGITLHYDDDAATAQRKGMRAPSRVVCQFGHRTDAVH